ncbi:MAG: metallophosphoesterase [Clostridia bacterium]|nr:metallophosphoesterase [Clostridia bacterium]
MEITALNTARSIKFNNGKLKIMHVTDTHMEDENINFSLVLIARACDIEKPDVVIVTGDNVQNYDDSNKTKEYIARFMKIFDERKIPVAITFGNHDSERGPLSRRELMEYYNTFDCSVTNENGKELAENGTYNIPVLSTDGKEMKYNLWVFDSGDYDDAGHYGCVSAEDVEWYKKKSDLITAENGKKIYSLAFQHIIVPEVYDVLKKVSKHKLYSFSHMYNKKDFYMFDPTQVNFGTLNETPCCGFPNYGQFDAMVEKGDVLGIFTGHDHTNAFGVKCKGIDIVNSLSTRYNGDRFATMYGYRIIEVDENDTSRYTSYNERWYNMFSKKDIKELKATADPFTVKTALAVTRKGRIQKLHTRVGRGFTRLVTGRQVTYND